MLRNVFVNLDIKIKIYRKNLNILHLRFLYIKYYIAYPLFKLYLYPKVKSKKTHTMMKIMDRINIFPHELTNRASWNGRRQVHTCYGTACTVLYVLIMFAFVTYYTIPVLNNDHPKIS